MLFIQPQFFSSSETIIKDGTEIGQIEYMEPEKLYQVTSITGIRTYSNTRETAIRYLIQMYSKVKTKQHPKLF